jgi:ADP-heptose:LPS heptosyltransferase
MNLNMIRRVDQWIGVPLCFAFTLQDRLMQKLNWKKSPPGKVRQILFLKPAEMGTSVIAYPMLQKAKALYPDAKLYFVAFEENVAIFVLLTLIPRENIFTIRTRNIWTLLCDTIKIIWKVRKLKIDTIIDLEFFSRYTSLFSYFTGARRRVGFHRFHSEGLYRGDLMTHQVSYNYYLHVGLSFMSLLYALKYPPGRVPPQEPLPMYLLEVPKLSLTVSDRENIFKKLKQKNAGIRPDSKIVALSPNSGPWLPFRNWPLRYYAELSRMLLAAHDDLFIVITGTHSARGDSMALINEVKNERLINLTEETTLKEFIDLLHVSRAIVSVDSGPAHFAALTNTGIVCIFGPDTEVIFSPLSSKAVCLESDLACHPCFSPFNARRPNCPQKEKPCLLSIAPQRVFEEVVRFL